VRALAVLVSLLGALQESTPRAAGTGASGLAVERTVRRTLIDWLGRKREIQRRESILIRGSNVIVTDLTFGEKLIIRTDQKKVWMVDPLGGHYSAYSFDEAAAIRKASFDELRSVKARVPGTKDETELHELLEAYDQFDAPPRVELSSDGAKREIVLNGMIVRLSAEIDPAVRGEGYFEALTAIGAFHPAVAEKLATLGGLPRKGRMRYVLFMDRVIEEFEVTSATLRAIPDSEFDLPKGLVQIPLAGFGRPPERKPAKPVLVPHAFKEDEK
jgi:hypothetical protein